MDLIFVFVKEFSLIAYKSQEQSIFISCLYEQNVLGRDQRSIEV